MTNNDSIFFSIHDVKLFYLIKKVFFSILDNTFNNEIDYSCFVMDDTGYIALHDDFVYVSTKVPPVEGVHITQKVHLYCWM